MALYVDCTGVLSSDGGKAELERGNERGVTRRPIVLQCSLGATYRHSENWTFRIGVAYDQTPVPDADRTAFLRAHLDEGETYWE